MEKLFTAKCCLLGFEDYEPIGDLYCDYSLNTESIVKYYIRERFIDNNGYYYYNDIPIDYNTLEELDMGIDLSLSTDITFCAGDYIINE